MSEPEDFLSTKEESELKKDEHIVDSAVMQMANSDEQYMSEYDILGEETEHIREHEWYNEEHEYKSQQDSAQHTEVIDLKYSDIENTQTQELTFFDEFENTSHEEQLIDGDSHKKYELSGIELPLDGFVNYEIKTFVEKLNEFPTEKDLEHNKKVDMLSENISVVGDLSLEFENIDEEYQAQDVETETHTNNLEDKTPYSLGSESIKNGIIGTQSKLKDTDLEKPQLVVLEPENPVMMRFQNTLKQHLLKQKYGLSQEILTLEGVVKTKQNDKLSIGNQINTLVCQAETQNTSLSKLHKIKSELKTAKEQVELHKDRGKERSIELFKIIAEETKTLSDLKRQLDCSRGLLNELIKYEKEQESTFVLCNQKESQVKYHKKRLLNEQQKQDLLLLSLTQEIIRLEDRLKQLGEQAETKYNEKELLKQKVMDCSTDLDTINGDNTKIALLWNEVLISIQQRDRQFHKIKNDLQEAKNRYKTILLEANSYKRSAQEEIKKNEDFTTKLNKLKREQSGLQQNLNNCLNKLNKLRDEHSELLQIIKFQNINLNDLSAEQRSIKKEMEVSLHSLERISNQKLKYEDEIVDELKKQLFANKHCIHMNNKINEVKTQNKEHELMLVQSENSLSQILLKSEQYRSLITNLEKEIDKNTKIMKEKGQVMIDLESELNKLYSEIERKSRQVDVETKHLEAVKKKFGEGNVMTPQLQVVQVKKKIEEIGNEIDVLKESWLKKQSHNMQLTQERNEQIEELNKVRKYTMVVEAKNVKLEQEITRLCKETDQYKRKFVNMRNAILKFNEKFSQSKGKSSNLSIENEWIQNAYIAELKENEQRCLEYTDYLKTIKNELDEMRNTYLEKQRENISWDNKIKQIIEMKKEIHQKEGDSGEIDAMKNEIHRMQIRESQLKKTLEKIMSDLEGCITRREMIYNTVAAKDVRLKGKNETKQKLMKKLDDLRMSIQKSKIECKKLDRDVKDLQNGKEELESKLIFLNEELNQIKKDIDSLVQETEYTCAMKIKNIEQLSQKQNYAKYLDEIKQGKYRLLIKNEEKMNEEITTNWKKNADIINVVETLKNDFPDLNYQIIRLINLLTSIDNS
ncbi:putative leucine-rich repeat-containing protein DDB_G0290503 [Adelges cooleyi]|uniref:putative leucine-rich repeat-containing protein DDB_G0290503 n=1 Tax=Adelges cooleyi TaxID=133065 RepID=UPI002180555D|nr:putative leucine-rich repeat-containing protein DDB_G0290503 [Adelges cooleyi]